MALTPVELPDSATDSERALAAELQQIRIEAARFRHQISGQLDQIRELLCRLTDDVRDDWWRGED